MALAGRISAEELAFAEDEDQKLGTTIEQQRAA